jgi:hypothetical protein
MNLRRLAAGIMLASLFLAGCHLCPSRECGRRPGRATFSVKMERFMASTVKAWANAVAIRRGKSA